MINNIDANVVLEDPKKLDEIDVSMLFKNKEMAKIIESLEENECGEFIKDLISISKEIGRAHV